jgi:hypothetical protein
MNRQPYILVILFSMMAAFVGGATLAELPRSHAQEQLSVGEPNKILVYGYGTATSTEKPPGQHFTLIASSASNRSFKVVPPGKTFILTDMMYNARGVRQNLTVNLANGQLTPERADKPYTASILLQVYLKPSEAAETHLCTGYVIPAGHSLMAWTNAGLEPDQWVQVAVTGYLIDER